MRREEIVDNLINALINEDKALQPIIPSDYAGKRNLLRALMNIRIPYPVSEDIIQMQDELLKSELEEKDIVDAYCLPTVSAVFNSSSIPFTEKLVLWKGDITTIASDAIVNAANSKLLGCFIPLHKCIDNVIHSASGMQLRLECNEIMAVQGFTEPTGSAKITKAYNLPSKYVIHTVGPIIYGNVSSENCELLASCYTSCLNKANNHSDIKTIAFCSISTGEFRFPKDMAARIAVETVCGWLQSNTNSFDRIIFDVFSEEDYNEYAKLFRRYS